MRWFSNEAYLQTEINIPSPMPDEDIYFGGLLALDF